ncbi:replicative DNA helicase [Polymorphospora lycopeni]|uniref:replicative DNA helicase n=1 Tax=Polymorphospora lycopeni TaxID=3140240 RepID=UPI0040630E39
MNRVADLAQRRTIEAGGVQLAQAATTPGRSIDDLTALAESLIAKAAPRRRSLELAELGSLINPALDDIEHRAKRKAGIPTGYTDLDRLIGGMQPKQMITVAGATGMGKSITLVDIARHVAIKQRLKVAFFSLEMRTKDIFDRILSAETGVLHTRIRDGLLDDNDWQRVTRQIGPMANAPLYLSDKSPMRVADMARICRKMQRTLGLDLVVIDHMHLVKPSNDRIVELPAVIANVSPDIKREIAMALDVPTLVAAQFNRNPSNRLSKIPELGDLKGSSAIEQDSDVVILAHREDYYDKDSPRCGEADFVVAKCRIGERGIVTVAAQLHLSRFVDMAIN